MSHKNKTYVIKADGTRAPFDYNKIRRTCIRAGVSRKVADGIANRISRQIHPGIRTSVIYKMVLKALDSEEGGHVIKHRYRLKESIMHMGPAGSQFEEYVARILENSGFQINSLRSEQDGRCVKHEIDISAYSKSTNKRYMIECKYHNLPGIFTGIKESLYTHARFLDLASLFDAEMLVTNTKVSTDVITYASCIGQEVLSWRYPPENSLEKLIEVHGLYPLTILPFSKNETLILHENGITMAKDLLSKDSEQISHRTGISSGRIRNMQDLARKIIA
ncbi:MAG: restriction endonuclease [Thaumarchaeota archaeon]|nr:restriction endonuclease [Nitrososphaerota archaeon]